MLTPVQSTQSKKDVKKARKWGKDLDKLKALLSLLIHQTPLPEAYQDHLLRGNWKGYRDAHIEPDWLLLYQIDGDDLHLARTLIFSKSSKKSEIIWRS
jgi:mRNA interferase YafQ